MSDPQSPAIGGLTIVPVTSAWASKVNWTQAVSGFAMILAFVTSGHISMTPEQQMALVVTIGVATNIATWILHTFFTPGVKAASLTK
jgi:hypothetical protein